MNFYKLAGLKTKTFVLEYTLTVDSRQLFLQKAPTYTFGRVPNMPHLILIFHWFLRKFGKKLSNCLIIILGNHKEFRKRGIETTLRVAAKQM